MTTHTTNRPDLTSSAQRAKRLLAIARACETGHAEPHQAADDATRQRLHDAAPDLLRLLTLLWAGMEVHEAAGDPVYLGTCYREEIGEVLQAISHQA